MGRRITGAFLVLILFVSLNWERLYLWRMAPVEPPPDSTHELTHPTTPTRNTVRRPSAPAGFRNNPLKFLSTAPIDSLVLLPGIGPVIAERVASLRTGKRLFTRWEDLLAVRGIGQKKLERLKQLAKSED